MFYPKKQKGFTIVETMIVLAVTGALFVSASLLISGQIERYRYRDSMYRLRQSVQDQINDVQSGQFYTEINANDGTTNNELVGKRVLFCAKDTGVFCEEGKSTITSFNVEITQKEGDNNYSSAKSWVEAIPGGLEYIGPKIVKYSTRADPWGDSNAFGFDARYSNGPATDGVMKSGAISVDLYSYSSSGASGETLAARSTNEGGKGFLLCFSGYKKGSLELGSKELGNTVKLNLVDDRCD